VQVDCRNVSPYKHRHGSNDEEADDDEHLGPDCDLHGIEEGNEYEESTEYESIVPYSVRMQRVSATPLRMSGVSEYTGLSVTAKAKPDVPSTWIDRGESETDDAKINRGV